MTQQSSTAVHALACNVFVGVPHPVTIRRQLLEGKRSILSWHNSSLMYRWTLWVDHKQYCWYSFWNLNAKVSCLGWGKHAKLSSVIPRTLAQDLCDGNYMTIERIRAGNDVALVCDCPFGATPVAWFKDNNETATFTGSDIYTVHVLSADDGGYYSCRCNAHSKCFLLKGILKLSMTKPPPPSSSMHILFCFASLLYRGEVKRGIWMLHVWKVWRIYYACLPAWYAFALDILGLRSMQVRTACGKRIDFLYLTSNSLMRDALLAV